MGKAEIPVERISCEHNEKNAEFQTLPKQKSLSGKIILQINGFWCPEMMLKPTISFQKHFQAKDTDILLATFPKAGTTWLKALAFSIINRSLFKVDQSPLLTSSPHLLVPFDFEVLGGDENHDLGSKITFSRQVLATHIHYEALPRTVFSCKCRVVYLCRNPLDQFTSIWHFLQSSENIAKNLVCLDEAFELFLQGKQEYGPIWDQISGYWHASLKDPEKVLFLKYEDLRKDTVSGVKKIAQFLGVPFSEEEENNGLIGDITKLCSFESLSNMEVNKSDELHPKFPFRFNSFFRKGKVGDWANYLTPDMVCRATRLIEKKFGESGLTFEFM